MTPQKSYFLDIPPEIRLMVYEALLDSAPDKVLCIRNVTEIGDRIGKLTRTAYNVTVRCGSHRENLRSTYISDNPASLMSLTIMRVNRQIYTEMAAFLYSTHIFDFGRDIEAVIPFLRDRNPWSRNVFREMRLRVRSPLRNLAWMSDQTLWRRIYRYLGTVGSLKRLTIVVEGEQAGARSADSDIKLTTDASDDESEVTAWANDIPSLGIIKEVKVIHASEDIRRSLPPSVSEGPSTTFPMSTGSEREELVGRAPVCGGRL